MYAGMTIRQNSGKIVGVHQKIDRVAYRNLNKRLAKSVNFPTIKEIIHFEGKNGPDGLKIKSPGCDEPWHFINPADPNDQAILVLINDHIFNLQTALIKGDKIRAAFEAAWAGHAITDGLTPAHHYPLNDKIEELWGKSYQERQTAKDKAIIHGENGFDTLSKNWQYYGVGGIFTAHAMYELGVATAITPEQFRHSRPSRSSIAFLKKEGFDAVFMRSLSKIYDLKMYDHFGQDGWTLELATQTKDILIPEIIKVLTLAWYQAALVASEAIEK
jgi:hypothetical protein